MKNFFKTILGLIYTSFFCLLFISFEFWPAYMLFQLKSKWVFTIFVLVLAFLADKMAGGVLALMLGPIGKAIEQNPIGLNVISIYSIILLIALMLCSWLILPVSFWMFIVLLILTLKVILYSILALSIFYKLI